MKRSAPAWSWVLAVVAVATLACRAPSGGAEHDPAPAMRETDPAPTSTEGQPSGVTDVSGEPTTRADEHSAPSEPTAPLELAAEPGAPPEPAAELAAEPGAPPEPAAEPTRGKKTCRRPGPRAKGPLRDLVGLDEAAVRRCLGPPDRTSGSTWHYQWPKGCAYEVTRVVVRFARGTVTKAHAEHEITGKHCGAGF